MCNSLIPIVVIVGPTASGKTKLSIEIAKKFDGEVVSADSMQIYKQMNIGSAKPSREEMAGIPHHLIDFLDISEEFSVADYVSMAHNCIRDIYARGKLPIICGGTGLYVSSLIDNIQFSFENINMDLRHQLNNRVETEGIDSLLDELKEIDVDCFNRLKEEKNPRRIIRAIEIYRTTGITMTEQLKNSKKCASPYNPKMIGLSFLDRNKLYKKISDRVDNMIENGLVDEARSIIYSNPSKTAMAAIGYKEFVPFFKKNVSLDDCIERIKINTRHYAKRQITWFKRDKRINWVLKSSDEDVIDISSLDIF